jgi:hypothetical protein
MTMFELLDYVLIVWGIGLLITNFFKPSWYWNGTRMKTRRESMGDEKVSNVYYGLAAIMLAIGLLGRLGVFG